MDYCPLYTSSTIYHVPFHYPFTQSHTPYHNSLQSALVHTTLKGSVSSAHIPSPNVWRTHQFKVFFSLHHSILKITVAYDVFYFLNLNSISVFKGQFLAARNLSYPNVQAAQSTFYPFSSLSTQTLCNSHVLPIIHQVAFRLHATI